VRVIGRCVQRPRAPEAEDAPRTIVLD
jgi:hypothetical protein